MQPHTQKSQHVQPLQKGVSMFLKHSGRRRPGVAGRHEEPEWMVGITYGGHALIPGPSGDIQKLLKLGLLLCVRITLALYQQQAFIFTFGLYGSFYASMLSDFISISSYISMRLHFQLLQDFVNANADAWSMLTLIHKRRCLTTWLLNRFTDATLL